MNSEPTGFRKELKMEYFSITTLDWDLLHILTSFSMVVLTTRVVNSRRLDIAFTDVQDFTMSVIKGPDQDQIQKR